MIKALVFDDFGGPEVLSVRELQNLNVQNQP